MQLRLQYNIPFLTGKMSVVLLCAIVFSLGSIALQAQNPFITTWKTDNPGTSGTTSITIPTFGSGYNYSVDWNNDGIYDQTGITGDVTHDFGVAGTYTIRITGSFPRIYFASGVDYLKIMSIDHWGSIAWSSMAEAFYGCSLLVSNATDAPDLSGVTNLSSMFNGANSFNGDLSTWNTALVTNMNGMFYDARSFNGDISTWNTALVTKMDIMFYGTTSFHGNLNTWNTGNVTNMNFMFGNSAFNGNLSTWNTANVTNMTYMFYGASSFNQNIGTWDLNANVNMSSMLDNSGMDCYNYSATLIGWNSKPATPDNRTLGAVGRQYGTNSVAARTNLITTKGWTITGDAASGQDCSAPLPVELSDFQAKVSNGTALLTWRTASERNNQGFEVEWSLDGRAWTTLGFVAGHGSSQQSQAYRYVHVQPQPGLNYYRLRQMDVDGKSDYSAIRSVRLGKAGTLSVFPNPVSNGELHISLPDELPGDGTLRLFSATGQLLRQEIMTSSIQTLDVAGLPAGIYLLEVMDGIEVWQERVVLP